MKNPRLERLNQEHRTAEIRLTREKHRQKQQQAEAKELTRKARTRRLCTRGGMLESFLQAPNILTDDDVMEFLTCMFGLKPEYGKLYIRSLNGRRSIVMSIGDTIYSLRKDSGLTQKDLAENLGVNFQTVSK